MLALIPAEVCLVQVTPTCFSIRRNTVSWQALMQAFISPPISNSGQTVNCSESHDAEACVLTTPIISFGEFGPIPVFDR